MATESQYEARAEKNYYRRLGLHTQEAIQKYWEYRLNLDDKRYSFRRTWTWINISTHLNLPGPSNYGSCPNSLGIFLGPLCHRAEISDISAQYHW